MCRYFIIHITWILKEEKKVNIIKLKNYILILCILVFLFPYNVKADITVYSSLATEQLLKSYLISSDLIENKLTVEGLLKQYIPRPPFSIIHSDNLEFKGQLLKDILPVYTNEMKKMGWEEIVQEQKGSTKYFFKVIDGKGIKLSASAAERGGPEVENTSTFIYFRIASQKIYR
jgi:hypothetical protein